MYDWIPSLKHYTSYLAILLVSLLSNIIGAGEDAVPLSLEQLEEKLEKHKKLLNSYNDIEDYMARVVETADDYTWAEPMLLGKIFSSFRGIIQENIENLKKQIEAYDKESHYIRGNHQNDFDGGTVHLSRDQLEEKVKNYRQLLDTYNNINGDDMVRLLNETNHYRPGELILLTRIFNKFEKITKENIKNLEKQIEAYDEENPDISNNNQHNDSNNSDRRLYTQYLNMPLYLKIILGILVIALISFMPILIRRALPKKKKKQTKNLPSASLGKYKRVNINSRS